MTRIDIALKILKDEAKELSSVTHPVDVIPLLSKYMKANQEYFVVIILDGAHQVTRIVEVSKGLVNRTVVHPREVFAPAIVARACAVIIAHNHPSGRLDPSPEDVLITNKLVESGEILGITVLDHLIVGRTGYVSMTERGYMKAKEEE